MLSRTRRSPPFRLRADRVLGEPRLQNGELLPPVATTRRHREARIRSRFAGQCDSRATAKRRKRTGFRRSLARRRQAAGCGADRFWVAVAFPIGYGRVPPRPTLDPVRAGLRWCLCGRSLDPDAVVVEEGARWEL